MVFLTVRVIRETPTSEEKLLRVFALIAGFILFLGSKATVQDVPTLLLAAIATLRPIQFPIIGSLIPVGAGALAAWFLIRSIEKDKGGSRFTYLVLMLGTFIVVLFADIYAISWKSPKENGYNQELLANLSFTIGLLLYILFGRRTRTISSAISKKKLSDWGKQ